MSTRIVQEAREIFGIEDWGAGYFDINSNGDVVCQPSGDPGRQVALQDIIKEARRRGMSTPLIIRFPQIISGQLHRMHTAFGNAINECNYQGRHLGVFPFKVNQRREFIDAVVSCGRPVDWGLEVGSKTEFMAALSYPMAQDSLLVCNGFKDQDFIDMAFTGAAMGRNIILVVEGPDELELIVRKRREVGASQKLLPQIGLRVRLYSKGSGKWEKSSGDSSKFGLSLVELIHTLRILEKESMQDQLSMLHFHIGSQITAIKRFKNALKEAARLYAKIVQTGVKPKYLNIGGGVGVDYDGSRTSSQSSVNYSMQEFANDAVYVVGEICKEENVPCPDIVTESGRVIAAYHSVVVTDIREVQGEESFQKLDLEKDCQLPDCHKTVAELTFILKNISTKNYNEYYHDAVEFYEELFTHFNLGYIDLHERAVAEHLFHCICQKALKFSQGDRNRPLELENLQKLKVVKYLANFSIFQSIPDAWSIDQLFPIMPLSRHNEKPSHKGTIVDITCDSDGCIDQFIDREVEKSTLDLHTPDGNPYYIGFFLVGAYQESLSNEHNLFGAIHELEVFINEKGDWYLSKLTDGDPIHELLTCRNYSLQEMINSFEMQFNGAVRNKLLTTSQSQDALAKLKTYLNAYPYLNEKENT